MIELVQQQPTGVSRVDLGEAEWIEVTQDGLFHCFRQFEISEDDEKERIEITRYQITKQPVTVFAHAVPASSSGEYGLLIRYKTIDGRQEERIIPRGFLSGPGKGLLSWIGNRGISVDPKFAVSLQRYFALASPERTVTVYSSTGWQTSPSGRRVFVLGGNIVGTKEQSIFQSESQHLDTAQQAGTLEDWIEYVAKPACQVPWWGFAIMASLASPLLELLSEHSRGIHVFGESSRGKTIGASCAASVFGKGTKGDGFMSTWSATGNGIEALAELHRDLPLVLDELGQADGRDVGNVIYMLSNNAGKARLQGRGLQQRRTWNTILLSTGELSLSEKLKQSKRKIAAGMTVRFLELSIKGTGFVKQLESSVVRELERAVSTYYGTAGVAFIEKLITDGYADPASEQHRYLRARVTEIENQLVGDDVDNKRRRAARAFAVVRVAGELGVWFGVLPGEIAADETCMLAYQIWRDGGPRKGSAVDYSDAARQLLDVISQRIDEDTFNQGLLMNSYRCDGWYRKNEGQVTAYVLGHLVDEVVGADERESFLKMLNEVGVLVRGDGKNLASRVPMVDGRPRAYRVEVGALERFVNCGVLSVEEVGRGESACGTGC